MFLKTTTKVLCLVCAHGILIYRGDRVMTQRGQYYWKKNLLFFARVGMHATQGHMESTSFGHEAERNEKKARANAFIGFSAEKAKQGRINSQDWWVSIILAGSGLQEWSLGASRMIQSRRIWHGVWKLDKKGGWGIWTQGWLVCIWKLCSCIRCYLQELAGPGSGTLFPGL